MDKHACTSPPSQGKCLIDDYSQLYLALSIPGSRLNPKNSLGTRSYCSHQQNKTLQIQQNGKNSTPSKIFNKWETILTGKFPDLRVCLLDQPLTTN